jgi:multicomponent Na+:H+ antiporter subunit D
MTKIWGAVFWTPHPEGREPSLKQLDPGTRAAYIVSIGGLAALTVLIGLVPQPLLTFSEVAAQQLLDPGAYIDAVLGEAR